MRTRKQLLPEVGAPAPANTGENSAAALPAAPERLPATRRAKRRKHQPIPAEFVPRFWDDLDRRLHPAKEIVRRVERLKRDSGADSYPRHLLCERAAFLSVLLESAEVEAGRSGRLDVGAYIQGLNALTGLLKALGLGKAATDVGDLRSYLGGRPA
jgi:hypothetical protein